ncbi:transcriptional regulator [Novosphingobium resinovorum]|uniref:anti-sigma factor family protein n=1 Tax=Novosphingobium resinovorum TaxID=158500 RepID=UPI002ED0DFF3|nr:transcriptional regulator [Novosphingobium resinovorum]
MSVTDEEFAAYADGELAGPDADRIAAAIASDPALAARLDAECRLRQTLHAHFAPVTAEPVPERLTLPIVAAAAEPAEQRMTDSQTREAGAAPATSARIFDLASARVRRNVENLPRRRPSWSGSWTTGIAAAAALVLGIALGTQVQQEDAKLTPEGTLLATGRLAKGLETRLAADVDAKDLRILASFQREGGGYCRVYAAGRSSGIACRESPGWVLERTTTGDTGQAGTYRQAGSAQAELMGAAQDMAAAPPLDAAQERAARARGWGK